jgi:hypothetical protein
MHIDGIPRYHAEAGQVDGQLAMRITGTFDPALPGDEQPQGEDQSSVDQAAD